MTALQPTAPQTIALPHPNFGQLVQVVEKTVAASSARVYRQTFDRWLQWTAASTLSPFDLTPRNVSAFLDSQAATKSTKQRQLSALRKLVEMLSILDYTDPAWSALHAALKKLKVQHTGGGTERSKRALTPAQADKVLRAWDGDTLQAIRNRALMAVLFLAGLRRSEAVALRWADVDLTEGVLTVRHGKGDKAREVPLLGDFALEALERWKAAQSSVAGERQYVFCPLKKSRNVIGEDRPMPNTDVYRVVKATEQRTGIVFAPHDARRTLLTEYIDQTGDVPGAQRIAGHANEATTLRYAQAASARELRRKAKLRYG
jgi:integrase/recombinase XerD